VAAATAHASLQRLNLSNNRTNRDGESRAAAGAALGALVAANAPALRSLNVCGCLLGDDGLRPLFQALPANTHLHELNCRDNSFTQKFGVSEMQQAVSAHASLRKVGLA
jgi:hypothetical protein